MMLRIISCSVKGYTSLSLDVFVPKHHYMHVYVCLCDHFHFTVATLKYAEYALTTLKTVTELKFKWLILLPVEPHGSLSADPRTESYQDFNRSVNVKYKG